MNEQVIAISDTQILSQLKKRRLKLTLELERVAIAIRAFEEIELDSNSMLEVMAIDNDAEIDLADMVDNDLKSLVRYSPNMKHEQKAIWALGQLKEATAIEIADFIMHHDTTIKHRTAIINAMRATCSWLKRWGKIELRKNGRFNYYSLKG